MTNADTIRFFLAEESAKCVNSRGYFSAVRLTRFGLHFCLTYRRFRWAHK